MELFISEAEIEDASMIIDYLNQVGGESDNLTYGLNECYLNEFEEMEVIQDFIDQEIGRYPQMFNVNQKYYDALLMNLYID